MAYLLGKLMSRGIQNLSHYVKHIKYYAVIIVIGCCIWYMLFWFFMYLIRLAYSVLATTYGLKPSESFTPLPIEVLLLLFVFLVCDVILSLLGSIVITRKISEKLKLSLFAKKKKRITS